MVFYGYEIDQFQTDRADPQAEVEDDCRLEREVGISHPSHLISHLISFAFQAGFAQAGEAFFAS